MKLEFKRNTHNEKGKLKKEFEDFMDKRELSFNASFLLHICSPNEWRQIDVIFSELRRQEDQDKEEQGSEDFMVLPDFIAALTELIELKLVIYRELKS